MENRQKKALLVTTVSGFIPQFQMDNIDILENLGYEIHYAANYTNPSYGKDNSRLDNTGVIRHQVDFERNPFSINNIKAYRQLKEIMNNDYYDLVHCHTPMGAVIARIVARRHRKIGTKVIYTVHGFHFYQGAPIKNWLFYYPVEKYLSRYTDILITINQEDYKLAKKKMKAGKVKYIPGVGIDLSKFNNVTNVKRKREELQIPENACWVLTVGELIERKNHKNLINAIKKIDDIYLTIAGQGKLKEELENLIVELGLTEKIKLIGYRMDICELCKAADIFAFPSYQEGLPVALMEAMACGKPVVCSRIRGNIDLIDENKGGIYFDPNNIDEIVRAIEYIKIKDANAFGKYNYKKIQNFDKMGVRKEIYKLYMEVKNTNDKLRR